MESNPESTKPKGKGHDVLLGKYELGRLLGRGTFAKVYHARALADGSSVAIKVLDKPSAAAANTNHLILREVSAMRRLSPHPNILRLHEVMATRSKIYLVMEHAPAGDLLSLLSSHRCRRLPDSSARRLFRHLLSALRFSHARGVAHRDLKPQNLLLDSNLSLKISDFGLAALAADARLRTACGTPAYAAPEVIRANGSSAGYDGAAADAWSCGVILFVLLAGSLPFDDSNLPLMIRRIHRRDYRFPPWMSAPARRVVARLLDPNPESRITLDGVMDLPWYKRSDPDPDPHFDLPQPRDLDLNLAAMNAFDIISMSPGLNLSGLFREFRGAREKRFTSTAPAERILRRIEETGAKLGFSTERRAAAKWWGSVLSVGVLEVATPLLMVELRVECDEAEGFCWSELRAELGDIVSAWHNNGN